MTTLADVSEMLRSVRSLCEAEHLPLAIPSAQCGFQLMPSLERYSGRPVQQPPAPMA